MLVHLPEILKKSAILLVIGIIILGASLAVSGPLSYLFTIGVGTGALLLALVGYLWWFLKELKQKG